MEEPDHRHRRLLRARRERPRSRAAEKRGKEFSSSDVACHVTLRLGVIHAMEGSYHASIARSVPKQQPTPPIQTSFPIASALVRAPPYVLQWGRKVSPAVRVTTKRKLGTCRGFEVPLRA